MNNDEYYVIFYDNIQLTNDDQNRYKMLRIVSNVVDFERETKIAFDDRVSHNMKIFINKIKKNVTVFASHKKVFTSMKKKSNRFFKKRRLNRFQQKSTTIFSKIEKFFETSKIVMNDALFSDNDIDFSRFRKRRNIAIKVSKRYELSQLKNDESIVVSSKFIFKFKKRFKTIFIINDENSDVRTFIKKFKFVIKQQIENFLIESQLFVIKNLIKFQKFLFKRSTFYDSSFFFNSCRFSSFYVDVFYVKIISILTIFYVESKESNYSIDDENQSTEKKISKATEIFSKFNTIFRSIHYRFKNNDEHFKLYH